MKYAAVLIYAVLFPLLLQAQQSVPGSVAPKKLNENNLNRKAGEQLDGLWLFQPGDSATWLSDSLPKAGGWQAMNPAENLAAFVSCRTCTGIGWLKYYIRLADTQLVHTPLVMESSIRGAVEIYLDGRLILDGGQFSRGAIKGTYMTRQKKVSLVLGDTAVHELLVKYEDETRLTKNISEEESDTKFTIRFFSANYALDRGLRDTSYGTLFAIAAVFLTFSFFHFILFLFYRKDLSNLFFSLFNAGMGVIFLAVYQMLVSQVINEHRESFYLKVIMVSVALTGLAFSGLVNNLFGRFALRFKIILFLSLGAMVLMWISKDIGGSIIAFTQFFIFIEVIFLLLRAYLRKVPGAQILALGILLNILFVILLLLVTICYRSMDVSEVESTVLRYSIVLLSILSIFCIPMSMSVYLATNVARNNAKLSLQLRQIEALSAEKQSILEHQKETLEREVADRTAELSLQKKKSDDLLLNILPAEVAEELKEKGNAEARHFNNVTVLFSDFVNFTTIAERSSPEALVKELHTYFRAFDSIMEKHGLEKIKTIGDAYLAVSGLPQEHDHHAHNAVLAALDMLDCVRALQGSGHSFEVRIGINSGPLVAGIVGVKKFAYDIWGDTVNMASRMESNSEAGMLNISRSTYDLVRDRFRCSYRGKIKAKNKGEVDMYFVEGIIETV